MQPSRRRPLLVGAAVLGCTLLLAVVLAVVNRGHPFKVGAACGTASTVRLSDGSVGVCTFDDEFSAASLDPAKWQVLSTTQVGFHSGLECFVDDAQHVDVAGGELKLTLTASPPGGRCRQYGLSFESGMVITKGRFAQTYGRFSIRAELPDTPGIQPALWLYPERLTYGKWPASGEIDIAELFGNTGQTWPHLHFLAPAGIRAHPGTACTVTPGRFHTYTVDWTRSGFTFRYDGSTCYSVSTWTPAPPARAPAPFDRPFFMLLELATGSGANAPTLATPIPETLRVDYVRVWGA